MTRGACGEPVLACQRKPGHRMIECFLVELKGGGVPSQMFFMAFNALRFRRAIMIPLLSLQQALDFVVTGEAFCSVNGIAHLMALRALLNPVQPLMRPRKISGGKLREQWKGMRYAEGYTHDNKLPIHVDSCRLKHPRISKRNYDRNMCCERHEHDDAEGEMNDMPVVEEPLDLVEDERFLNETGPRGGRRPQLIGKLAAQFPGARFAVLGGEEDRAAGAEIAGASAARCLDLTGKLTLPEMVEWLRLSALMITNDTGPMHVAAALGRPVVALFGPTEPRRTGPYGQLAHVLQHPLPCVPCMKSRCSWHQRFECLRGLAPETVARAVSQRLARLKHPRTELPRPGLPG